jgi:hypothetical protein
VDHRRTGSLHRDDHLTDSHDSAEPHGNSTELDETATEPHEHLTEPHDASTEQPDPSSDEHSITEALDAAHHRMCAAQAELLSLLSEIDPEASFITEGFRYLPCFVSARYGISNWKANRWVQAASAFGICPRSRRSLPRAPVRSTRWWS